MGSFQIPPEALPALPGEDVLRQIAKCANFTESWNSGNPCSPILNFQKDMLHACRNIPEPWRGNLDARLLFVSSNPSLDYFDNSPTVRELMADERRVLNYFNEGLPPEPWIRMRHGGPARYVKFWDITGRLAGMLWGMDAARPGHHFCITEIVHCKSQKGFGVTEIVRNSCVEKHWRSVLALSQARLVVLFGLAANQFNVPIGSHGEAERFPPPPDAGWSRTVIALPHPSAHGNKMVKAFDTHYRQRQPEYQRILREGA